MNFSYNVDGKAFVARYDLPKTTLLENAVLAIYNDLKQGRDLQVGSVLNIMTSDGIYGGAVNVSEALVWLAGSDAIAFRTAHATLAN